MQPGQCKRLRLNKLWFSRLFRLFREMQIFQNSWESQKYSEELENGPFQNFDQKPPRFHRRQAEIGASWIGDSLTLSETAMNVRDITSAYVCDDGGETKKTKFFLVWFLFIGWGCLDNGELHSEKTVSAIISPGHFLCLRSTSTLGEWKLSQLTGTMTLNVLGTWTTE